MVLFYDKNRAAFAPLFGRVAATFPSSSVAFAQYDIGQHAPPPPFDAVLAADHRLMPAVYFYRQGSPPERYTGSRTVTAISKWIKAHPHIKHAEL